MNGMIQPIPDITTETYRENPALALYKVAKQLEENQRVICTRISLKNEEQDKEIENIRERRGDCRTEIKGMIKNNTTLIKENKEAINDVGSKIDVSEGVKEETRKDKLFKFTRGAFRVTQFGVFMGFCYFIANKFIAS